MSAPESPANHRGCTARAPAKVNVSLDLLGKRCDGYHELRTTMVTLGLCDTVRVRPTNDPSIRLRVSGAPSFAAGAPTGESNLVFRAAEALRSSAGVESGATVDLIKRVPSQAGLGGGSSDAAATLVAANRAWSLGRSTEQLADLGATLGSDIPFFVHAIARPSRRAALATGRGEEITTLPVKCGVPIVVAKPDRGLSTAAVYSAVEPRDFTPNADSAAAIAALATGRPGALVSGLHNALFHAARRVAPWIGRVIDGFRSLGCRAALLSGSGSACFAIAGSHRHARRVAAAMRGRGLGWAIATRLG